MTNLLEKALLLGFGIFLLTIFSSLLFPFLDELSEFNKKKENNLDSYMAFIDEVDHAVLFIIDNPEKSYFKNVRYPINFNTSFLDFFVIYEFLIENDLYSKVSSYNTSFSKRIFHGIPPQMYLLNVSCHLSNIFVNFIKLE